MGLFPSVSGVSTDYVALQRVAIAPVSEELVLDESISASGVVIYDMHSGQQLFGRQARIQRPMASLTKLMTALLIVENHAMDEIVTIPANVVDTTGNKAYLPPGKRFTVGDLLSALLINSANDAALTLAQYHSGSVPAFVDAMNKRALQLGMTGTSFRNPAGLDDPAHWSTPQDIAWLAMFDMRYDDIASRLSSAGKRIVSLEGDTIQLYHTHVLLHEQSPVIAGKTGTTNAAGQCLMSIVEEGGKEYMVVLLHSEQRYKDMETILNAFNTTSSPVAEL
ncbi:MAG: D-alanyl-D-alanine carboxypeptidase [Candidatus Peregrinibacteria bacterium]|nr:D-alanyl-D-alanine carboxypeptidase [Candidatus Peregrinibacteria bacterium]